jgi:hypothetical protein
MRRADPSSRYHDSNVVIFDGDEMSGLQADHLPVDESGHGRPADARPLRARVFFHRLHLRAVLEADHERRAMTLEKRETIRPSRDPV